MKFDCDIDISLYLLLKSKSLNHCPREIYLKVCTVLNKHGGGARLPGQQPETPWTRLLDINWVSDDYHHNSYDDHGDADDHHHDGKKQYDLNCHLNKFPFSSKYLSAPEESLGFPSSGPCQRPRWSIWSLLPWSSSWSALDHYHGHPLMIVMLLLW